MKNPETKFNTYNKEQAGKEAEHIKDITEKEGISYKEAHDKLNSQKVQNLTDAELKNTCDEDIQRLESVEEEELDESKFESMVTKIYFEDWEKLEITGNSKLKERIKRNIIEAEETNREIYENAANNLGISVENFKERLQAKVEEMVSQSSFFVASQFDILDKIINDGRWKTQFETQKSNGTLNPMYRGASEIIMFGYNMTNELEILNAINNETVTEEVLQNNKEKRPIYGYFSDDEHGAMNIYRKGYASGTAESTAICWFGNVIFKIKKEVALKRATITFHDSLHTSNKWPPTPSAKPHFTSFRLDLCDGEILNELKSTSIVNWGVRYTEAQYHDGLTMDDIESIHISTENGVSSENLEIIREIFETHKKQDPNSDIQLIEF